MSVFIVISILSAIGAWGTFWVLRAAETENPARTRRRWLARRIGYGIALVVAPMIGVFVIVLTIFQGLSVLGDKVGDWLDEK